MSFRGRLLRTIDVQVIGDDLCRAKLDELDDKVQFDETVLCTGLEGSARMPCTGDSGSALVVEQGGRAQVIGIAAMVYGCGTHYETHPALYTNVSSFIEWIETNMISDEE